MPFMKCLSLFRGICLQLLVALCWMLSASRVLAGQTGTSPSPDQASASQVERSADGFSLDYTGALFGYYRMEAGEKDTLLTQPNQVVHPLYAVKMFQPGRSNVGNLLLGMGDNFAPEFGASLQLGNDCVTVRPESGAKHGAPGDWYKRSARFAASPRCDNVTHFLMAAGYRAVVPGREDFLYSADWLQEIARQLQERVTSADGSKANHEIPDTEKLHLLASNLRAEADKDSTKGKDKGCPLLFAPRPKDDAPAAETTCVSSGGENVPEAQDWVERLDLTLQPKPDETDEERASAKARYEAGEETNTLAGEINKRARESPLVRRQLMINQVEQMAAMNPNAGSQESTKKLAKEDSYVISENAVSLKDDAAYKNLTNDFESRCKPPRAGRKEKDLCEFERGLIRIFDQLKPPAKGTPEISQSKLNFLLTPKERTAGLLSLLRVIAEEEKDVGFTFSDRRAKDGKTQRTLLVALVGVGTMKAVSPTNLKIKAKGRKVTVLDPRRNLLTVLRAAKVAADDEVAGDTADCMTDHVIRRTIVMAQMPRTEAEELGAHVQSELRKFTFGPIPAVDLILSEAQADHATPTEHITYAHGTVSPVMTPHPAFNRDIGGLVNPVSTATLEADGIDNRSRPKQLSDVCKPDVPTALRLLETELVCAWDKQKLDRKCSTTEQDKVDKVDPAEAQQFLLQQLHHKKQADVVMLERRDIYLDEIAVGYTGYEVCDRTPNLAECRLRVALDRVLWKGDFLERVMVTGKDLKTLLTTAQSEVTEEQNLAARDTADQWLVTYGITTSDPKQLTRLEVQSDRFSLPQDDGCKGNLSGAKPEPPYCVNGSTIADDAAYWVATSDHLANDSVLYTSMKALPKDYHEGHSAEFLTLELSEALKNNKKGLLLPLKSNGDKSKTPIELAQDEQQDRSLVHLDYGKLVAGFNVRAPQGGNAAAGNFQGVADTRASQPTQQELDLESVSRISVDVGENGFWSTFSFGVQTDAEYDRAALGNLTGKPINASYSLNSFTANAFLQKRIPFFGDAKTTGHDWANRELPRTLVVLTPHQYQQQITGSFLSLPFTTGSGEFTLHLPRVTGFVDKLGIRHELGGGKWWKADRNSYAEGGAELGIQNSILESATFFTGGFSQSCSAKAPITIAECVTANKSFPVDATTTVVNPATGQSTLVTKTLHASGLYWDMHFQKGLLKDPTAGAYGINVTLDTKGDFFFERAAGDSLSTQTRYAFPITAAVNFPILRNMSLSPTFTSFLYESQVTRQSITVNSFMISAHWYYAHDSSVPFRRQLFFSGPKSLDQTQTAKIK
jgi:hypothetical protein